MTAEPPSNADADEDADEDGGEDDGDAAEAPCGSTAPRVWKLTPVQLERTARSVFADAPPVPESIAGTLSASSRGFAHDANAREMSQPHVENLFAFASDLADYGLDDPGSRLAECLPEGWSDLGCVEPALRALLRRAFRRPVDDDEQARFIEFYRSELEQEDGPEAMRQTLRAIFMSPFFLYRTELGDDGDANEVPLTSHERAAALSFLLTDGPPDAELLDAADADELLDPEQIEAHARRLLETPEGGSGLLHFFDEHYRLSDVELVSKDKELFPEYSDSVAHAMAEQARKFVAHVLWSDDARFDTLLTADYTVANEQLQGTYGLEGLGEQFERVPLPADRWSGLLTHPAVMSSLARPDETDIVRRGQFVREMILCDPLPPPPEDADVFPPPSDDQRTQRERLEEVHSVEPGCAVCHSRMDPIGFAFEHYASDGSYRELDNGRPIDASGWIEGDSPATTFDDAPQLAARLATHPGARACFVRKVNEYSAGRALDARDACMEDQLNDQFASSDGDIIELVVTIVTNDAFLTRYR